MPQHEAPEATVSHGEDNLTRLANRARFDDFLRDEFTNIAPGRPLTLIVFDLDRFENIFDTYGHDTGYRVIQWVAGVLKTASRLQDLAGRYGGGQMALALPGTSRATGAIIADTIRRAVAARTVEVCEQTIFVTVSAGVATAEWGGRLTTPAHLIMAADMAVDAAKRDGGNCVKVCALPATAATAATTAKPDVGAYVPQGTTGQENDTGITPSDRSMPATQLRIGIGIVCVTAALAFSVFVWPTRYQYDHAKM